MCSKPTVRPCIAPIQFLCHDYGPVHLPSLDIDGGTVTFFERHGTRYLITALHVWDGILALSEKNAGRKHGAFIYAGKFLPLTKDEAMILRDPQLDVIVMQPRWLQAGMEGFDFYDGSVARVSGGETVQTWGYPGARRTRISSGVTCSMEEISGKTTEPCNDHFKFTTTATYDLGGFSGAPVFRDGTLVGLVSEASSSLGIVTCCDWLALMSKVGM